MEDLDYDLPPPPVRGPGGFYRSGVDSPQPQSSIDISDVGDSHSRLPSVHNSSYSALPLDRPGYGQAPSPLGQGYHDNPSQTSLTGPQPPEFIPQNIMNEKRALYANAGRSRRKRWITLGSLALILVVAAIAVGIFFAVAKPHGNNSKDDTTSSSSPNPQGGDSSDNSGKKALVITGGNGSTITTEDGSTFTYINNFAGTWYADPQNPFANRAQAQSYTPPLNTSWQWGVDKIYG